MKEKKQSTPRLKKSLNKPHKKDETVYALSPIMGDTYVDSLIKIDTYIDTTPDYTSTPEFMQFAAFYDGSFPKNKNSYYYKYNTIFGRERSLDENDIIVSQLIFAFAEGTGMFSKNIFIELTRLFFFSLQYTIPTEKIENFLSYQCESFDDKESFIKFINHYLSGLPEKYKPRKEKREIINKWLKNKKSIASTNSVAEKTNKTRSKKYHKDLFELIQLPKGNDKAIFHKSILYYMEKDELLSDKCKTGKYILSEKLLGTKFNAILGAIGLLLLKKKIFGETYLCSLGDIAWAFVMTFNMGPNTVKVQDSLRQSFANKDWEKQIEKYRREFSSLYDWLETIKFE